MNYKVFFSLYARVCRFTCLWVNVKIQVCCVWKPEDAVLMLGVLLTSPPVYH